MSKYVTEGVLRGACLKAARKALAEDRLFFRASDMWGRSCNGGSGRALPAVGDEPGPWTEVVEHPVICERGWHATMDPLRWSGHRVALVEVDEVCARQEDKVVCHRLRELGAVNPWVTIYDRIRVATDRGCSLIEAVLVGASLDRARLVGASLDRARLDGARLDGARLDRASLDCARLDGARLDRSSLVGASLVGASLVGASLVGASLDRARLDGARLDGARLDGARLDRASLDRARLDGARLDGARLDRSSLVGASLVGASLDRARLDGASLVGATACNHTTWPAGFDPKAHGVIVRDY